jgi:hypothetical protein
MESDHADRVPPPGEQPSTNEPPTDPSSTDPSPADPSPTSRPPGDPLPTDRPLGGPAPDGSSPTGIPAPGDRPAGAGPVSGEPHLTLVDAVLASARSYDVWQSTGGPRPQLPRGWENLWRDAVRRQTDLSGEPEEEARRSVQAMLDQLTRLDREAGWFRTDQRLRTRAISETLLHGTGLGPAVPSRSAQLAWKRQRGLRPVDYSKIQAIAAAQDEWLAAWNEWATTH